MVAFMRCVLAVSALAIIYLDPTEPARFVELTYASLAVYCLWSFALFLGANAAWGAAPSRWSHWIDVGCATYLIALTEGTNSIFFFLFMFAILVASFSRGFREGVAVTVAATALFLLAGVLSAAGSSDVELNRALIRPVYMLALGGMMAFWGGREIALRRRLLLLRELSRPWRPEMGVERALGANLERLREFFGARQCLLVLERPPGTWKAHVAMRDARRGAHFPSEIDEASAQMLLALPEAALTYERGRREPALAGGEQLANILEAEHFASVPYSQRDGTRGRLYVMPESRRAMPATELEFLVQVTEAIAQLAENVQFTEQLRTKAAEQERFRISLDIHDMTVQPYIGLKLALDALYREAAPANPLAHRVAELVEMANMTIRDLRGYAVGLRENVPFSEAGLAGAIQEQAMRMRRFYAVEVDVRIEPELRLAAHVAAEIFRIVSEGLSNVLRHTPARRAFVRLSRSARGVHLAIGNEIEASACDFVPRSISARVRSLGGAARVDHGPGPYTVVNVEIPA